MRSIVPNEEKPACSARRAQSTMPARPTPRTALGNPIPISITSLLWSWAYGGAVATGATLDELPGWARTLLAEARVGHLGLIDGQGRPRVLPVTFAIADGE